MRLVVGLGLSLLVLAAGEMVARRVMPGDACMKQDELLGFSLKPYASCWRQSRDFNVAYQINSLGLRNREISEAKSAGVKRILLLGDSFTEGTGVSLEVTFSKQLEDLLKLEVINAGVSGYSTLHEYVWLKERGLKLKPDLIILNVNETDFSEAAKYHSIWKQSGYTNLQLDKPSFLASIRLIQMLRERLEKLLKPEGQKAAVFIASDDYWQLVRSDIARINFLSRGKGIPLLVVFQPHGHHVSPTAWGEGRLVHGFELGRVYPPTMPKLLEASAGEIGFEFLDLTPTFASTEATKLYFPYDGHWTGEGHKLAAETIYKTLNDYSLF